MCSNVSSVLCSEIPKIQNAFDTDRKPMNSELSPEPNCLIPMNAVQPFDQYKLQLCNYALQAERLRFVQNYNSIGNPTVYPMNAYNPRWAFPMSLLQHRLTPDEPKPQHSYIGLIAMAILSSPESKLVLSDIYQYILDNYPYFRTRGPGWRNSIRHNLSLNDCFIKAGRSANGKGHYWSIHPANIDDFKKGDFRRRKAQRKVRKHMGLAVDDDGNDSPSPPPMTPPPAAIWPATPIMFPAPFPTTTISRKRQFDVASLLAPDDHNPSRKRSNNGSGDEEDSTDIDVVTSEFNSLENPVTMTAVGAVQRTSPQSPLSSWCYPIMQSSMAEHQQFMAKYYEHLNQARTHYIYQQLQMHRRISNLDPENNTRIEELDNNG